MPCVSLPPLPVGVRLLIALVLQMQLPSLIYRGERYFLVPWGNGTFSLCLLWWVTRGRTLRRPRRGPRENSIPRNQRCVTFGIKQRFGPSQKKTVQLRLTDSCRRLVIKVTTELRSSAGLVRVAVGLGGLRDRNTQWKCWTDLCRPAFCYLLRSAP